MIELTENAVAKIKDLILEENDATLNLRVFVQGGGCSGMQYGFTFDNANNEDDFIIEKDGIKLLIDSMSGQYLTGAKIDYIEDLMGSQFKIENPNAQTSCGCGSSFSPY